MTKKDYVNIAKMLRYQYVSLCQNMSDWFKFENELFDRDKFMDACGIDKKEDK